MITRDISKVEATCVRILINNQAALTRDLFLGRVTTNKSDFSSKPMKMEVDGSETRVN